MVKEHTSVKTAIVQCFLRGLVRIIFRPKMDFTSDAAKNTLLSEPCVIVSNHVRGFDGAVILTLLRKKPITALVAQDMLDKYSALRRIFPHLPCISIDREHPSLAWLRESRAIIKAGGSIYLCPEGKCSFDHVVRAYKPGFVTLAAMTQVPVVPVYHNGEYHPFPLKRFRMLVGDPVYLEPPPLGLNADVIAEEANQMHAITQQLEAQLNGSIRALPRQGDENEISH